MFIFYAYLVTLFIAPQLWLPPFQGLRIDLVVYPVWALWALMSGRFARLRFGPADAFFAALIAWIGVSILVAGTTWWFIDIVVMYYLKWFVLYLLIRATVQDASDLRRAAFALTFIIYILVVEGIQHKNSADGLNWAGQPLGWVDATVVEAGGSGRLRWVGVFDGIGVFAVVYTMGLPFVLKYASAVAPPLTRWMNRLGLLALLVAIYYTGSRGGFLAVLAVTSLYLAVKYRISVRSIVAAAVVVTLAFTLAPSHVTQMSDQQKSAQNRVDTWAHGMMMLSSNPVTGVGRGNFYAYTPKRLLAHNSAMEIVAETGVVGLFLWVSLIVACMRTALLRHRLAEVPMEKAVLEALMLSVAGYLVSAMFVTLEFETLYMLLALCAGNDPRVTESAYRKSELLLVLGIMAAFVAVMKTFVAIYF